MVTVLVLSALFIGCLIGADRLVATAAALLGAHLRGVARLRRYDAVRAQRALLHRPSGRPFVPVGATRSQPVARPCSRLDPTASRAGAGSIGGA